jgi:hypothetical protein
MIRWTKTPTPEKSIENTAGKPSVLCSGGPWDDPGWLLEHAFYRGFAEEDTADTLILAWLTVLPSSIEPPQAARSLLQRLGSANGPELTARQGCLLSLLAFVATHQRVRGADKP